MTGWVTPKDAITTKQIKEYYNLQTSEQVFITRRRLEILGYIEPVRKGSQTYHLRKHNIPGYDMLHHEYVAKNYTYTMPKDYHAHIQLPLSTMIRQLGVYKDWNGGESLHQALTLAIQQLTEAYNLLPNLDHIPFVFTFTCPPIHDTLMNDFGREKRLINISNLLEATSNQLKDVYHFSWTASELLSVAVILNRIKIPNTIKERQKKV